jgi:hypothetical protein
MKRALIGLGCVLITALTWGCSTADNGAGGGSGGAGGTLQSSVGGSAPCEGGTVSFELKAPAGGSFFVQEAFPPCAAQNWLKVFDKDGNEQGLIYPGTSLACASCTQPSWSDVCTTSTADPLDHTSFSWDGHRFGAGTCGTGATCVQQECAPPGQYIAAMCGTAESSPNSTHRCIQVAFSYPASAPVVATLPAAQN